MDPISLVVSPIVGAVITEATSLIKSKYTLLQGVAEDLRKLESKLSIIGAVLEDAEDRQLENKPLRDWLGKLNEAAYDADDLLETLAVEALLWDIKKQKHKVPIINVFHKFDDANKIKDILARINEIAEEKNQFFLNVSSIESRSSSSENNNRFIMTSHVNEDNVVGRDDDRNKIISLLTSSEESDDREGHVDDDISVIPIIGMGGLGKTTLAQLIYNDDGVKNYFEFRMWVCVTINFNYTRILKEMIEKSSKMTYDINLLSEDQLESRFLEFLPGKRFLLVLDDVWIESYAEWEKLHKLLKLGGKGCKVLITGRNIRVSEVMGTQPPHLLEYLPEDQCWSLFERIVFKGRNLGDNVRRDLEIVGRKIVGKCQGLPLAVKAMAGVLLGNNDVRKWERILRHEIWKVEKQSTNTGEPIVLPALKLSYDHLTSHLKHCFAYCYIFPKAYAFDKIELVKLWKAQSFIENREGDTMDEIGYDYFEELVRRSFFQLSKEDKKEIYKMHDLIHDLAQSVSIPSCYQVKDNNPHSSLLSDRSRHVSFLCKDAEQPALQVIEKSKKLRTLLSPSDYQITFGQTLDKMFRTLKYIRVLDLSSSVMVELPKSVEELKLLRYLDLSKTEIRTLPDSICNLFYLQTLKLLGCLWLSELPKDLGNLRNLQHLELDEMFWYKLSVLPPRIGRLISLKNLHAFHVSHKSGYRIDELKEMKYLEGTLHISKLENAEHAGEAKLKDKEWIKKVVFEWSNRGGDLIDEAADENIIEELQPHSNVHELQILRYGGTQFPSWIRDPLLQNLVSLSLNQCTKCKILSLGHLPNLRNVYIKRMEELEEWPDMLYPLLDTLKISHCLKLKKLPSVFPNLRVLKIKKCDSQRELPLIPSLQFLMLVDNLVLESWNEKILVIRFVNGQGQFEERLLPSLIRLLELKIMNCPKLQALPEHFYPQKLEISGCQLLSNLPTTERSPRLQHLALHTCHDGTLVRSIPNTSSLYSLVISNISSLTSIPKLPHLPGLKVLYISECKDLESLSSSSSSSSEASFQGLTSIKLLSIRNCPKLVTFPSEGLPATLECLTIGSCPSLKSLGPSDILKSLTSLKDLYIEDCPSLQSLPEKGLSNSVQHLHVEGCPLLVKRCEKDQGPDWSMIKDIPDLEFESIEVFSVQTSPTKMERVKPKASSSAWYHHITCRGTDTSEILQPRRRDTSEPSASGGHGN